MGRVGRSAIEHPPPEGLERLQAGMLAGQPIVKPPKMPSPSKREEGTYIQRVEVGHCNKN
jgi:hypothetical protein